jgi:hypothetical protein
MRKAQVDTDHHQEHDRLYSPTDPQVVIARVAVRAVRIYATRILRSGLLIFHRRHWTRCGRGSRSTVRTTSKFILHNLACRPSSVAEPSETSVTCYLSCDV